MIEKIFTIGLLFGFFIRDILGLYQYDQAILIYGTLLGFLYLIANWWLNKPKEKTPRTIIISVLYGIVFSGFTFSILFKLLFFTGSDELALLSMMLLISVVIIDFISAINRTRVINKLTVLRIVVILPIVGILVFVNEDTRIRFIYRKNQGFIKFYEANKENYPTFHDLQEDYRSNHKN